jgi:hypothetical protein
VNGDAHACTLGFIGQLVPHAAKGPLMQFLIVGGANIQVAPDGTNISDH